MRRDAVRYRTSETFVVGRPIGLSKREGFEPMRCRRCRPAAGVVKQHDVDREVMSRLLALWLLVSAPCPASTDAADHDDRMLDQIGNTSFGRSSGA
jgi:hypothetical protein